jgi:hypothetical protein
MPPSIAGGLGEAFDYMAAPTLQEKEATLDEGTDVHVAAARGVTGPGAALPFLDTIQASFGDHDLGGVRAHTGADASGACEAIGASAYATGNDIAFGGAPDLHTAAHEAAHVVQQRGGVHLKGGVGERGDVYEREADAVADRVVAGESAAPLLSHYGSYAVAATGSVQKDEPRSGGASAGGGPASDTVIDEPRAGDSRPGFIDNSQGANLRNRPIGPGSQTLTAAPLPPATRVFVSGHHPAASDWWYVTAFPPGTILRGYVQGPRVTTDLPEPTATLYQIQPGDTVEELAAREFSASVRDGSDLRFYENVLLHVNRQHGRTGITGSFQDPDLLGGGSNNIQLVAGHRIWLVSSAYARSLQGTLPSGSLTGGAMATATRFGAHLQDILKSVTDSPSHFGEVAGEYADAIMAHLPEIIGITAGFILAEAASAFLAATPTGVGQLAALLIQLAIAAFGAHFAVEAAGQALHHASAWLTQAWSASGNAGRIAEASRSFLRMLVSIAMAALAIAGVRGSTGRGMQIAQAIRVRPPSLGWSPAMATPGGAVMPGGPIFTPGSIGSTGPVFIRPGLATATTGGSGVLTSGARANAVPTRARTVREAAEHLPDSATNKWDLIAEARAIEEEAAALRQLARESPEAADSLLSEIEALEQRLQRLDDQITAARPATGPVATVPRPHLPHPANHLPIGGRHPYTPPRRAGNPEIVRHPEGNGFLDELGNRWEWARDPHGGPHWDVQHPDGHHTNVYPDGMVHQGRDRF